MVPWTSKICGSAVADNMAIIKQLGLDSNTLAYDAAKALFDKGVESIDIGENRRDFLPPTIVAAPKPWRIPRRVIDVAPEPIRVNILSEPHGRRQKMRNIAVIDGGPSPLDETATLELVETWRENGWRYGERLLAQA